MAAASRPSQPHSNRPWYLLAALVAAWIYGAEALSDGYSTMAYHLGGQADAQTEVQTLADRSVDPAAREQVVASGERWLAARDAARSREYPIGIASLLLGGAMILFAARSMAGREGARSALVQVVFIHAGLVVAEFFVVPGVSRAYVEFSQQLGRALVPTADAPEAVTVHRVVDAFTRAWPAIQVLLQSLLSGLIVLALTRPRVRALFQATPEQLEG